MPEIPFTINYFEMSKYEPDTLETSIAYKHEIEPFNSGRLEIKFFISISNSKCLATRGFISNYGYLHNDRMITPIEFISWIKSSPQYQNMINYMK